MQLTQEIVHKHIDTNKTLIAQNGGKMMQEDRGNILATLISKCVQTVYKVKTELRSDDVSN